MTYRLDSDLPSPYGIFTKLEHEKTDIHIMSEAEFNQRKPVAWMVSNCDTINGRNHVRIGENMNV
jgi:hypothetical protein